MFALCLSLPAPVEPVDARPAADRGLTTRPGTCLSAQHLSKRVSRGCTCCRMQFKTTIGTKLDFKFFASANASLHKFLRDRLFCFWAFLSKLKASLFRYGVLSLDFFLFNKWGYDLINVFQDGGTGRCSFQWWVRSCYRHPLSFLVSIHRGPWEGSDFCWLLKQTPFPKNAIIGISPDPGILFVLCGLYILTLSQCLNWHNRCICIILHRSPLFFILQIPALSK